MKRTSNGNEKESVPLGIEEVSGYVLRPVSSLHVRGIGDFATGSEGGKRHYQSTFQVKDKHERLPSGGVKFNVETLPTAEENHLKKPIISREHFLSQVKEGASAVYEKKVNLLRRSDDTVPQSIRLEAVSKCPENLVFVGGQGFFAACLSAFAQHLPLAISPDHIWALVSYAFAKHVDANAEELRSNFVQHEGKKRLLVVDNYSRMSGGDNPDSASTVETWEQTVFSSFSAQIKEHIGEKIHNAIAGDFSTTTATCRAAHEITLMSAMKHYFSYGRVTHCGIPNITLLGSEEDWVTLRARAEALGQLMTPDFSALWVPVLLPVLDEFVASYNGTVNHGFWQSMVKLRYRGGSGARSAVSGWLQLLFPYLNDGRLNSNLRPWQEMYFSGPKPENIPPILSSAPLDWDYNGTIYDLHVSAGFIGCTQDPSDGTLTPAMGWYVTHDPPSDPKERLATIEDEMKALVKGHADEAKAAMLDKDQSWHVRVSLLYLEREAIYGSLTKSLNAGIERVTKDLSCATRYTESYKQELKNRKEMLEKEMSELESAPRFESAKDMIQSFLS